MAEPKIYVGTGKKHASFDSIKVSICLSDIPKERIKEGKNGKKYVNLEVSGKKEVDQYGNSHYVAVNTFKPQEQEQQQAATETQPIANDTSDLPF